MKTELAAAGTLVGRIWMPGTGPCVVALRDGRVMDISRLAPTMRDLLENPDAVTIARTEGNDLMAVEDLLVHDDGAAEQPRLLAPCDLQALKAAGVTFAASLLERVIEEQAGGDLNRAAAIRDSIQDSIGADLSTIRPGSADAMELKRQLTARGAWSQYLEVGIGPDAEVFTKAQPMSAVGSGAEIGIDPASTWNNPEPEVVLAVNSRGEIVGASVGNDVNLRDMEGRSALLLGRAKDNNGSCAIGPCIRLLDDSYGLDDIRDEEVTMQVDGPEGYRLTATSSMKHISRDILDLVAQTVGPLHRYPDGVMLFLGTMFAPTDDRDEPGKGFTHKPGDIVSIRSRGLGMLVNRVGYCDRIAPWNFGTGDLMRNLAGRGLL